MIKFIALIRGWKLYSHDDKTYYHPETGVLIKKEDLEKLPCSRCGELPTVEGYDACLGSIKGAEGACCGHGINNGYVTFRTSRGQLLHARPLVLYDSDNQLKKKPIRRWPDKANNDPWDDLDTKFKV